MERRTFIRGVLASVTGGVAAVKLTETGLLVPDHEVVLGHPPATDPDPLDPYRGQVVFTQGSNGEYHPLGFLVGSERVVHPVDATPRGAEYRVMAQGIIEVYFKVLGARF